MNLWEVDPLLCPNCGGEMKKSNSSVLIVLGNVELRFTVELLFSFPGGGLIIRFSNPSAAYAAETTPTHNLGWAETWAQKAVSAPFIGKESFGTLKTLADAQAANGNADAAKATMAKALAHPTATVTDYYQYARPMIREGKAAEAMTIFQQAAKRWPGPWPTDLGIARAYSAMGDYKQALKHAGPRSPSRPTTSTGRTSSG